MTLNDLKNSIPDFAKDVKLNFSSLIINSEYDEELVYGCAYASSLAIEDNHIASVFEEECRNRFGGEFIESVKATVIVMSLNNYILLSKKIDINFYLCYASDQEWLWEI